MIVSAIGWHVLAYFFDLVPHRFVFLNFLLSQMSRSPRYWLDELRLCWHVMIDRMTDAWDRLSSCYAQNSVADPPPMNFCGSIGFSRCSVVYLLTVGSARSLRPFHFRHIQWLRLHEMDFIKFRYILVNTEEYYWCRSCSTHNPLCTDPWGTHGPIYFCVLCPMCCYPLRFSSTLNSPMSMYYILVLYARRFN